MTMKRVIIDTDFSRWWDDVTALGIANVLDTRGTIKLLGVMSDVPNPVAVAAIDGIDTAYHHAIRKFATVAAAMTPVNHAMAVSAFMVRPFTPCVR